MNGLKLQSVQLLQAFVSSSASSQLSHDKFVVAPFCFDHVKSHDFLNPGANES